jgi:hypothetical protein
LVAQYITKLESGIDVKLNAKAFAAATGIVPESP